MKNGSLSGEFKRYSTGPLYSKRELAQTEKYLAEMGMTKTEDNRALGARSYTSPDGKGSALIYLDEVGAQPLMSGTMIISKPDGTAETNVVWDFAKQQSIAHTKNPVLRKIRSLLNI